MICYRKNQIVTFSIVSFLSYFSLVPEKFEIKIIVAVVVIDNEFRHNIVKVVCGSTAILTML